MKANLKMLPMKRIIIPAVILFALHISCEKENKIDDPKIIEFSATPTTLPKKDTVTFRIDAIGENITFFDGKKIIELDQEDLPITHKVDKLRLRVTAPADTLKAVLSVVNIYDADVIKEVSDTILIILLDE